MRLFLCGDVMTGRGVDQILPFPSEPRLEEAHVDDAREYVRLAERANGPIPSPVGFAYAWGDALDELRRAAPDARIANLETSVTRSDAFWPGKAVHYRMSPGNVPCLAAPGLDVCVLANNHVLDFGREGLVETLETLRSAGLRTVGAGRTLAEAQEPATLAIPGEGRLLVFAFGSATAGIPPEWAAGAERAGVSFLPDLSEETAAEIAGRVRRTKRPGDVAVVSIHWGGNWGYEVAPEQVRFAHRLIDGGVDLVHGHSSHHVRPIEVYAGHLVLYGCGDFLDDYEGIAGYERFRDDLVVAYFATLAPGSGELAELRMAPMQIRRMRLVRATPRDAAWLADTLSRIGAPFGSRVETDGGGLRLPGPGIDRAR